MFDFEELLQRIENKVKILAERLEEAERSRGELQRKYNDLRQEYQNYIAGMKDSSEDQPGGLSDRSIEGSEAGEEEHKNVKAQIDQYIMEIDHCIELLKEL